MTAAPSRAPALKKDRAVLIDTAFLLFGLTALFIATTRSNLVMDQDIWWHIRTGNWILANHAVPLKDSFSASAANQPWIAYSWIYELLVSRIFNAAGYSGIFAFTTTLTFLYTAGLVVFLGRYTNLRRAMILAFSANVALMPFRSPRPWLFTILFFTLELALLWIAREQNRPRLLIPVVALLAVWANVHIQFVYGLGLLGLFAIEQSLPPKLRIALHLEDRAPLPAFSLWMALLASAFATLLNPYGWNLYRVVFQYATETAPLLYVQEMRSMAFRDPANWVALIVIWIGVFMLGSAPKKSLLLIAGLGTGCFVGFRSQRDIWFPVTMAVVAIAWALRSPAPVRCSYRIAIPVSLALTLSLISAQPRFSENSLAAAIREHYPVDASRYIESHHLPGPIFNSYNWGGYLIWRLPTLPVAIDGRANLYEDSLANAFNTVMGQKTWAQDPAVRNSRTFVLEQGCALSSILRATPRYRLIYEDDVAVIFQPVP